MRLSNDLSNAWLMVQYSQDSANFQGRIGKKNMKLPGRFDRYLQLFTAAPSTPHSITKAPRGSSNAKAIEKEAKRDK